MSEARYYIDRLLDQAEQPQYECNVCGRPLHENKEYCSDNCWQADML